MISPTTAYRFDLVNWPADYDDCAAGLSSRLGAIQLLETIDSKLFCDAEPRWESGHTA